MAKLVKAHGLEPCGATLGGSSPPTRIYTGRHSVLCGRTTKLNFLVIFWFNLDIFYLW